MSLENDLFNQELGNSTLAESIDKAWLIYCNANHEADEDRRIALNFLMYAFNLSNTQNLNHKLIELMTERNMFKEDNPEYIPGLSPSRLGLEAKELADIVNYDLYPHNRKLDSLIRNDEILVVNKQNAMLNQLTFTLFYSYKERAKYRVHIANGLFYQNGKVFSTDNYVSHNKLSYAAFTLNVYGELSVFNHYGKEDGVVHSSLNRGVPVVCAG
jgi:hypothetical protein